MIRQTFLYFGVLLLVLCVVVTGTVTARENMTTGPAITDANIQKAVFAGGCFWCMEADFDKVDGVIRTVSGYAGGHVANPTYRQVSAGGTGHAESVEVTFDTNRVSYAELLQHYWRDIDPTTPNRQFCDTGNQYRTVIFTESEEQKKIALQSKAMLEKTKPFTAPIVTEIVKLKTFYPAETYHQNYYQKNPLRYKFYRYTCGRDQRLEELWGKKTTASD